MADEITNELSNPAEPVEATPSEKPKKRGKISKHLTEQNVIAYLDSLGKGYKLIGINWKKNKIHILDGFGNKKVVSLPV